MATLIIPTPLRKYTEDQATFNTEATTVGQAIKDLTQKYSNISPQILDANGKIRSFVKIFVGEDDIRGIDGDNTPLQPDTIVSIVPAIAGGSSNF
ncbi:MAG: MoaD/ThiS family protein [Chitinophagales bacterium]|nr:MoaD/ThiS family protein [Chitinophagales bacterium]MCZ2392235.1 MoaD/ThiS family protein [Chitinophagales bacterium]